MKKTVLILQARMGSSRLPGKSMMDLAGAPLIGRILERVKRCGMVQDIVLAIPDTAENVVLEKVAREYGVNVYAGSENNLVERYYQAALVSNAEIIARLPADNVAPEPGEIDRIIKFHLDRNEVCFSSNLAEIYNSGYPDGIGAEVFDLSLLSEIRERVLSAEQQEHPHINFFDYKTQTPVDPKWCPVRTIACPAEYRRPDLVLDVNTLEQYLFMSKMYEYLYPKNSNFHITDIIEWYDQEYSYLNQ